MKNISDEDFEKLVGLKNFENNFELPYYDNVFMWMDITHSYVSNLSKLKDDGVIDETEFNRIIRDGGKIFIESKRKYNPNFGIKQ